MEHAHKSVKVTCVANARACHRPAKMVQPQPVKFESVMFTIVPDVIVPSVSTSTTSCPLSNSEGAIA
jgi:hypothetical protein